MEEEDMDKKVQEYLQRKGLRVTELAQQGDRSRLPTSAPPNLALHSMPGGFISFPPNGHPYFPPPWPPHPLPVSMAQHAALASQGKPVINIDEGDDVRTEKRLLWKPDEDLRLVRAWLKYSNDPVSGNGKKNEQYWGDVLAFYNSTTSTKRKRKVKHLKDRFQKIKRSVGFFCWSLKKAASIDASEQSNEQSNDQLIEKALQFYLDDYKEGPFIVMHCWKVLRDEPKWHAILEDLEKSNKRKLGDEGEVGSSTPTSEDTREKEHVTEVKEAKRLCNGKGKVKANDNGLDEDMKRYMEIHFAAKRRHEEFIKVQLRVSDAKVEAARLKREAAMLKTYKSFISMNTRDMTDELKAEHAIGLKLLREKLFCNDN